MRYEKIERTLDLVVQMRARRTGMTLEEIGEHCGVHRRTAQRLRDLLKTVFPEMQERVGEDRRKRYFMPPATASAAPSYTADELADLEFAITLLRKQQLRGKAKRLESLRDKIRSTIPDGLHRRLDPDVAALIEAEGLAARPGPRPVIPDSVLEPLRIAVKACRTVYIVHRNRASRQRKGRVVHPYGFLFGLRHYLVARDPKARGDGLRLFSLANVDQVNLQDGYFERDSGFDLQAFAQRSFGVFQEKPFDVVWRFPKDLAGAAAEFSFHPTEAKEEQADGSLIVRFRAGGLLEMAWHLYCWGTAVEVLAPPELEALRRTLPDRWPGTP